MSKLLLGIIIGAVTVLAIAGILTFADYSAKNSLEHDQLRNMTCDRPESILEWAKIHTTWIDHQAYARTLYLSCITDAPRPILGH